MEPKIYLYPYTNQWWYDDETGRFSQKVVLVQPIKLAPWECSAFPGFVPVELLNPDGSPSGIRNFVLPECLYTEEGFRISADEAIELLGNADQLVHGIVD
jgi:hypothetical protein